MFIGAASGLIFAVLVAILVAAYDFDSTALNFLIMATYPLDAGKVVFDGLNSLWRVDDDVVLVGTGFIWYVQYGFFAGLFYKLLGSRFSRPAAVVMMAATIVVSCAVIFLANHAYWEHL
jgi:hypothetical protein